MSSMFLCHSSIDKPFVRTLARRLADASVHVWVDEAELKIGDSLIDRIGTALEQVNYVGVVLSSASIGSRWVQRELAAALVREFAEQRVVVVPILLERVSLPTFLRDKVYADFTSGADHDVAFARLLATVAGSSPASDPQPRVSGLTANEGFVSDLRAVLETVRCKRLRFAPNIPERLMKKTSEACSFPVDDKVVCIIDLDSRWFGHAGESVAIFATGGFYLGGKETGSQRLLHIHIPYSELDESEFQVNTREERVDRGWLYYYSLAVRGMEIDAPAGWTILDDLVRAVKLVRLLVKRYVSG